MVITPAYYESAFCLCELGATWIMGSEAMPLLVPPLDYDDLKAVLIGVLGLLPVFLGAVLPVAVRLGGVQHRPVHQLRRLIRWGQEPGLSVHQAANGLRHPLLDLLAEF